MSNSPFNMNVRLPSASEINPARFYGIVDIMNNVPKDFLDGLDKFVDENRQTIKEIDKQAETLAKANNSMLQELRATTKFRNPFDDNNDDDLFSRFGHLMGSDNFLRVAFQITVNIQRKYHELLSLCEALVPMPLMISEEKFDGKISDNFERLMAFQVEVQMNQSNIDRFTSALLHLEEITEGIYSLTHNDISWTLESYYKTLLHRHSVEGVEIQKDPILTDIAISIFENVDAHGEIEDGKKPDEVSAYSIRKAQILGDALQTGITRKFVETPGEFIKFIKESLTGLWEVSDTLRSMFEGEIQAVRKLYNKSERITPLKTRPQFLNAIEELEDVNPSNVSFKEGTKLLSGEERFANNFRNETLKAIVSYMTSGSSVAVLIEYVLERKRELKTYYQDENSFYVCSMGAGNPFSGQAPGSLTVIPGERPNVNMDEILGSGFDQVNGFIEQIKSSSQWHDLFVASSPSKSADKSNILLVGPMGCGKTEVLRAVGGDKKSLGIFAQGSDFLTCWKGEAEKNPKRLFEAALKLQRESGKQVQILIDEIDAILKKQELVSHGEFNLTLEFQILMDGVVQYPNLSVWGATNSPQNIPMPMIRRFNKVLIVGELDEGHRANLLEQFISYMPLSSDFSGEVWKQLGNKMKGATGDVIRKVADHVWREQMTGFVNKEPEKAKEIIEWLNDGEKFEIASFSKDKRKEFREKLSSAAEVKPNDVDKSIKVHLENIAIRNEIDTAVETYDNARSFLDELKQQEV